MTSNDFERIAKNATIHVMKEKYDLEIKLEDLELVWFCHTMGYKKCLLYSSLMGRYYVECTYNKEMTEMYVDVYFKESNTLIISTDFCKDAIE